MTNSESDHICEKKRAMKDKLVLKLIPYIQKQGLAVLKMDDAAKYMDISKATMYKYFASKDEIIACLVEQGVIFINQQMMDEALPQFKAEQQPEPSPEQLKFYNDTFTTSFKITTKLAFYLTDVFLQDLNNAYPERYIELTHAIEQCKMKLRAYFISGMQHGVFRPMNAEIFLLQLDVVLRKLIEPHTLMQHNLTLKQALLDFYLAMKHQVFNEKWVLDNQNELESFINTIILKMFRYE